MNLNASDEYEYAELSDDPPHTDVFLAYLQDVTAYPTQASFLDETVWLQDVTACATQTAYPAQASCEASSACAEVVDDGGLVVCSAHP